MEIEQGKFTAIIGTSGSGKSTLLNMLGGLDAPTEGSVQIGGTELAALDREQATIFRRKQIGFVFQNYNLIPVLTVWENIVFPLSLDRQKPDHTFIMKVIELLGLKERKTHLPNQLSGGQQQRVAIGRALMNAPQVMLADEPTGSLDSRNGQEIVRLLKKSNREFGQTLILVTHDENIALQADRIICISDGMVTKDERKVKHS